MHNAAHAVNEFDSRLAGPGNALGIAEGLSYITLALGAVVLTLQVGLNAL